MNVWTRPKCFLGQMIVNVYERGCILIFQEVFVEVDTKLMHTNVYCRLKQLFHYVHN